MELILEYLVYIYLLVLPIIPYRVGYVKTSNISIILLFIIFLVYTIKTFSREEEKISFLKQVQAFFKSVFGISLVALFAIMLISQVYAQSKGIAITETVRFASYIILFFIIRQEFSDNSRSKKLMNCYVAISLVLSAFGLIQYFTGIGAQTFLVGYSRPRLEATLENPNTFGAYLVLCIFPIIMLGLHEKRKKFKLLYIFTALAVLVNLIFTMSRGAFLGLAVGVVMLCILYSWKLIFAFIPLGAAGLCVPAIMNRIKAFKDVGQNESRYKIWGVAKKMIQDHPIKGVGNGNFIVKYVEYVKKYPELLDPDSPVYPSHNSYLKVTSELGVVGIAFFIVSIVMSIKAIFRVVKLKRNEKQGYFYMGFLAAVIGFLVMNCFDNLFFVPKVTTYFWVFVALAEGIAHRESL